MARSLGERANQLMVDRLIAQGALWSPALIAAFRQTPRHRFLDRVYVYHAKGECWRKMATRRRGAQQLRLVYSDRALITRLSSPSDRMPCVPISSSSQPSLMAQMLEDLRPAPGQRVLEVGAGTGYNAALLAHVVAPGQVWSIDVDREILIDAASHLRAFLERSVLLRHADGRAGFAHAAPFDRIMVTAATPDLEPAWLEQLSADGLLLAPLALAPSLAYVVCGSASGGVFTGRLTRAAYFMPLRCEGEPGETVGDGAPPRGALQTVRAPWSHWFHRGQGRIGWLGFIQALAFFGWLRGLAVAYRTTPDRQSMFGLSDPARGHGCWFSPKCWQATGEAGREVAVRLWRAFLDAGAPWPTEFRLWAAPSVALPCENGRIAFRRHGPRCHQLWELIEPRDRQGVL
jgi:protein-L-isoaspartate(D-aspartate) O-methyltransferase